MTTLLHVIQRVRNRQTGDEHWLYIAGDAADLTLNTEADLGCPEFDEDTNDEIDPPGFSERGLRSTIDVDTLSHSIEWADRLSGTKDDSAALDVIRYYLRFDAWPDTLNAPDPPSRDEVLRRLDREFSDKLGPEPIGSHAFSVIRWVGPVAVARCPATSSRRCAAWPRLNLDD